jgi:hypothetical protein
MEKDTRRSIVWRHFESPENSKVQCKYCKKYFCYNKKTTSNLLNHLSTQHSSKLKKEEFKEQNNSVVSMLKIPQFSEAFSDAVKAALSVSEINEVIKSLRFWVKRKGITSLYAHESPEK